MKEETCRFFQYLVEHKVNHQSFSLALQLIELLYTRRQAKEYANLITPRARRPLPQSLGGEWRVLLMEGLGQMRGEMSPTSVRFRNVLDTFLWRWREMALSREWSNELFGNASKQHGC